MGDGKKRKRETNNTGGSNAKSWRELMGEKKWEGLLDPLNLQLGEELIRYCKLIGVIATSFQNEKDSPQLGLPKHHESGLLSLAGLSSDYVVDKYLFASTINIRPENDTNPLGPQSGYSNWIGYVAVTTNKGTTDLGRREIVIAIRGTIKQEEWYPKFGMEDLVHAHDIFPQVSYYDADANANADADADADAKNYPKLQRGRYNYYTAADSHDSGYNSTSFRSQVLVAVKGLVAKYQSEKELSIVVTGFSMGGAFATLIATDIVYNGYNKPGGEKKAIPVTAFAFANAPVGDKNFSEVASKLDNLSILRVKHASDPNTESPTQEKGYYHVGKVLNVGDEMIENAHDLNVYRQAIEQLQQAQTTPTPIK